MSSNQVPDMAKMPDIERVLPDFFRSKGKRFIESNPLLAERDPDSFDGLELKHCFLNELQQLPKRPKFGFAGPKHQPNRRILKREVKDGRLHEYHATKGKRDYRA